MVTFFKTLDVTNLIRISKNRGLKFNMLLDYCIGRAAAPVKEFYTLPVGDKLIRYDTIAVNTIVKNKTGEVSSCDILFTEDLEAFNRDYLKYTAQVAESCVDRDLSEDSMVIGTSAIIDTEIDGAVGMNSGIFNNPFIIWGKYRKKWLRYELPISVQFHHTQMVPMPDDSLRICRGQSTACKRTKDTNAVFCTRRSQMYKTSICWKYF